MTEEEVTAFHEAAHAVFAAFGRWTKLAGPVALDGIGGDVVMSTDAGAIRRTLSADPGFDRDLPRIELVSALLAGPLAERMLVESGRTGLGEPALTDACAGDYGTIAGQLAQLDPPRPNLLPRLEREVRVWLAEPSHWRAIERFAAILRDRRRLEADEASAILARLRPPGAPAPADPHARADRALAAAVLLLLAALVLAAFWSSFA